jgi:hypothetical protein
MTKRTQYHLFQRLEKSREGQGHNLSGGNIFNGRVQNNKELTTRLSYQLFDDLGCFISF